VTLLNFFIAVAAFLLGLWCGTAWCWYRTEAWNTPTMSLRLRLWRAVTWLPALVRLHAFPRRRAGLKLVLEALAIAREARSNRARLRADRFKKYPAEPGEGQDGTAREAPIGSSSGGLASPHHAGGEGR